MIGIVEFHRGDRRENVYPIWLNAKLHDQIGLEEILFLYPQAAETKFMQYPDQSPRIFRVPLDKEIHVTRIARLRVVTQGVRTNDEVLNPVSVEQRDKLFEVFFYSHGRGRLC